MLEALHLVHQTFGLAQLGCQLGLELLLLGDVSIQLLGRLQVLKSKQQFSFRLKLAQEVTNVVSNQQSK